MEGSSRHVIVVDDEPMIGGLVGMLLERVGLVPIAVSNGLEALREMRQRNDVSLVITDLQMPELDGLELCRRLREDFPAVPVVAMSGSAGAARNHDLEAAGRAGAKCLLGKPFELEEFYRALAVAMGSMAASPV